MTIAEYEGLKIGDKVRVKGSKVVRIIAKHIEGFTPGESEKMAKSTTRENDWRYLRNNCFSNLKDWEVLSI